MPSFLGIKYQPGTWKIPFTNTYAPDIGLTEANTNLTPNPAVIAGGAQFVSGPQTTPGMGMTQTPVKTLPNPTSNIPSNPAAGTIGLPTTGSVGGKVDTGPIDNATAAGLSQIDQDYNNYLGQLSGARADLQAQREQQLAEAQGQGNIRKADITRQGIESLQGITQREQAAQKTERLGMQSARDLYRQSQQQNIAQLSAMGISSSSVAEALAENLGVEMARRIANISSSAQDLYQNLALEKSQIQRYVNDKSNEVDTWVSDQTRNIGNQFNSGIRAINDATNIAAQNKANLRQDLLTKAQQAIYQLQANAQQYAQALQTWSTQNQAAIDKVSNMDLSAFYNNFNKSMALAGTNPAGTRYTVNQAGFAYPSSVIPSNDQTAIVNPYQ